MEHRMIPAQLSYFSFPFSRRAYCEGRGPTSREVVIGSHRFRHYGRNIHEYTLVDVGDPITLRPTLMELFVKGFKLKSVNFTCPITDVPTNTGPLEWRIDENWDPNFQDRSSKTRQTIRRACRGTVIRPALATDHLAVYAVFESWIEWAKTRHFMVFRGHYERWLHLYFTEMPPETLLWVIELNGEVAGIFGGEFHEGSKEAQITIAKHRSTLNSKALWTLGLRSLLEANSPKIIHCGSTANELKSSLGMTATPSWIPDLKTIKRL